MSKPDIEAIRQSPRQYCTVEDVETLSDYAMALEERVEIIEQQLAAALAACKLKDDALKNVEGMLDELRDYPVTHDAIIEALAIQPDDAALVAWIGEPVAWECHTGEYGGGIWREKSDDSDTPIYSPKGLK